MRITIHKRRLGAALALFLSGCGTFGSGAGNAGKMESYRVVWDSPSADHHGSMPLGNGDIGLNAWITGTGDLHFYISKTDAWDDNARLVKVGKMRIHIEPNPILPGKAFRQELKLEEGGIEMNAGGAKNFRLCLWVDANHPAIHVTAESASPVEVTASIELWRTRPQELATLEVSDVMMNSQAPGKKQGPTVIEPDTVLTGLTDRIGWFHRNSKSVGPKIMAEVQGLAGFQQPDPLLHRTFGAMVVAAKGRRLDDLRLQSPRGTSHRLSVFVLTRHPSTPEQWLAEINKSIQRIEQQGFAARREAHKKWWNEFWERSWIRASAAAGADDHGDADWISRMYHLQRFMTACAGRGAYPIKFNGSLFTVPPGPTEQDPDYRRWGPGYWWQNTRLPYLSLCTTGDFDLQKTLFRMYAVDLLPLSKYRTRIYLNHDGAFYPECIMFWGATFSDTYGWTPFERRVDKLQENRYHKWEWVGGLELCWMMLDYYDHTLDRAFLEETALPFGREILTFFEKHYPVNAAGKLIMQPSQAAETWWRCTNPATELGGCIAVTERLLTLPAGLGSASDRELWSRLRAKLSSIPLRTVNGRQALAPAEIFEEKRNVENPELYPVFPFRLFAFNRPNAEWAVTALENRWDRGHQGWRQDDIFMAYLGLTDDARKGLASRARSSNRNERFPAFWGPNYDWTPDQDHGGVLMKTFQSMLLQTDGRAIFLMPAWPKTWDVEFKLHAPGRTVIQGRYAEGKLQELDVKPGSRRSDVKILSGK